MVVNCLWVVDSLEEQYMFLASDTSLKLQYKVLLNPKASKYSGIFPTTTNRKMDDQYVCKRLQIYQYTSTVLADFTSV